MEVGEMSDSQTVELGREAGNRQLADTQPDPAGLEGRVAGNRPREGGGERGRREPSRQTSSLSTTGWTDTTCRLNFSSDAVSPAATPTSCER
jgi:hypothetical protein